MKRIQGSFRDPSGAVYSHEGKIIRTVEESYRSHWEVCDESGFIKEQLEKGTIPAFRVLDDARAWKVLEVDKIPFITYPYEWSFSQLKEAALLTLELQRDALDKGLTLKDCSAYNVQFVGCKPVFIDLLSFEKRVSGSPWTAYRQFCMHFLAPLVLSSHLGPWCLQLLRLHIDGIPLDHAASMLPMKAKLSPNTVIHIIAHAKMESKHGDARQAASKASKVSMSKKQLVNLIDSLIGFVAGIKPPSIKTTWGDYYEDTNYSSVAMEHKKEIVERFAKQSAGDVATDFGANTGEFSQILKDSFKTVIAPDIDPLAVERHYGHLKNQGESGIMPIVLDVTNPSPAIGWASTERDSFTDRSENDFITALAVTHHLRITYGIPLAMQADYFSSLLKPGGSLAIEFVPKDDSQVQRMLGVREDVFVDYELESFAEIFSEKFSPVDSVQVQDSLRTLFLFRKK